MTDNQRRIRLQCDCHTHELEAAYTGDDGWGEYVEFAFWQYGHGNSYTYPFFMRIKCALRLLFKGTIESDMVILTKQDCDKLVGFLQGLPDDK